MRNPFIILNRASLSDVIGDDKVYIGTEIKINIERVCIYERYFACDEITRILMYGKYIKLHISYNGFDKIINDYFL